MVKTKETGGGGGDLSPPGKKSFMVIGEMAYNSIAWCSRGHTLKIDQSLPTGLISR